MYAPTYPREWSCARAADPRPCALVQLTAKTNAACKRAACTFTIAKSGKGSRAIVSAKSGQAGTLVLKVPMAKLAQGSYVLTVRKGKKTLGTTVLAV